MQCKFYMAIGVNGQRMTSLVSWMNLQVCILTPPPQKKINSSFSLYQQLYAEELFLIPAQIIYRLVVLRNILNFFFHFKDSPEEWMAENVAHLFILCGDVITSKMLISKAINGRTVELSTITTSFCVVKISWFLLYKKCLFWSHFLRSFIIIFTFWYNHVYTIIKRIWLKKLIINHLHIIDNDWIKFWDVCMQINAYRLFIYTDL